MLKGFKSLLWSLAALFIATACNKPQPLTDKTVFKYNEASGITSLDPAFSSNLANIWACNMLYNGLVQLDTNLNIIPCIASSWEISDDGKKYTFHLRNDVYFHNHEAFREGRGRRVVASDFVYSFRRILERTTASPGSWIFNMVDSIDHCPAFIAANDSTLHVYLKEPFPPFPGILSMKYCSVVPAEIVDYYGGDFRKNPIGTGPFRFQMWKEDVKLVLLKNENYFETDQENPENKIPYIDAVSITFLKDKQSAFLEFIKGNIDFMSGIDPDYKDELLNKRGRLNPRYAGKIKMITGPYLNTEYLGILIDTNLNVVRNSPLGNKYFRKAISYGIDRVKMMKYLRNNIGIPGLYGIIPPGLPSFDTARLVCYGYRPDLALKYLDSARLIPGEYEPVILETTPEYLDLCKFIQHQLGELGIKIELNINTPAAIKELKAQAKLGFFRASWIADYPDAENFLSLFYSKNFTPAGPNYTRYYNQEFDNLYETSLLTIDPQLRNSLLIKMNNLVMDDAPVIIMYYDQVLLFTRNNISGISRNPVNMLDLRKVKKIN